MTDEHRRDAYVLLSDIDGDSRRVSEAIDRNDLAYAAEQVDDIIGQATALRDLLRPPAAPAD